MNPALEALHRHLLFEEARTSVALDNDDRAHTFSFDDPTPSADA